MKTKRTGRFTRKVRKSMKGLHAYRVQNKKISYISVFSLRGKQICMTLKFDNTPF